MSGAGIAGFGGGFGQGLASVLLNKREQDREQQNIEAQRNDRFLQTMLPLVIDQAEDPAQVIQWLKTQQPGTFKGKQGQDKAAFFSQMLAPALGRKSATQQQDASSTRTASGIPMPTGAQPMPQAGGPMSGPAGGGVAQPPVQRPTIMPAPQIGLQGPAPPAQGTPQATFNGIPLMSRDQKLSRAVTEQTALAGVNDEAKLAFARRLLSSGVVSSMDEAMDRAGLHRPYSAGMRPQSVAGELADGTPAFGVFMNGQYVDPNTGQPIEGFRPRTSTGSRTLGGDREALAIEKFGKPASQLNPVQMAEVNRDLPDYVRRIAEGRGRGAGDAALETERGKLATPEEAGALQARFGITRGQAAELGRYPLTPPQRASAAESYLLEDDARRAGELFEKVWPRAENPEQRRLALMALQRNQQPEFMELMSLLKRMPLRLAVMTQGSRPSDSDRQVFDVAFPSTAADDWSVVTVPTSYAAGVQLLGAANTLAKTSRESIGILPRDVRDAQPTTGTVTGPIKEGGTAAPATPGKAQKINGVWMLPTPQP